jgi:hypothetical protein
MREEISPYIETPNNRNNSYNQNNHGYQSQQGGGQYSYNIFGYEISLHYLIIAILIIIVIIYYLYKNKIYETFLSGPKRSDTQHDDSDDEVDEESTALDKQIAMLNKMQRKNLS